MFSFKRLNFLKIISCLAFLLALAIPSAHADGNILTSDNVETKNTQYFVMGDDGKYLPSTKKEIHYYIRFEKDDPFVFVIPDEFMGAKGTEFYSDGQKLYFYEPEAGGPQIPLAISNRVLKARAALLGAKKYFDGVCKDANIKQTWWKSGPIEVIFGNPSSNSMALASAGFWNHQINVKPDMITTFPLSSVLIHEYFHMVYDAVWYDGSSRTFWKKYSKNSKDPFSKYLLEMTAEWATDEPIKYKDAITGMGGNEDDLNYYLNNRSQFGFFDRNEDPFFDRGEYVSNILIKYLTEQMGGAWGSDESSADRLLKMIYAVYNDGGVTKESFFKNIAYAVMSNYWPGDQDEVWLNFYTAFCASNLVQTARSNEKQNMPLGYYDDGFKDLQEMMWVKSDFIQEDVAKVPPKVYSQPAQNDEERMERMETILKGDELIEPLASKYHNLTFRGGREEAEARPVFVYAEGTVESDVFLIRQRYNKAESSLQRKSAKFLWNDKFNFKDQRKSKKPKALGMFPDLDGRNEVQELWVGLVNPSTSLKARVINWSWMAAPRLAPHFYVPPESSSKTVRITGGTVYTNSRPSGMQNGDTFEAEIRSTGPLHREGANLKDIAGDDRSITLEVLGPKNRPVSLERHEGKDYKVELKSAPSSGNMIYTYVFSGKIAEHNPITGDCHFKFKLASPLNLGAGDEQTDETYQFALNAVNPDVESFKVNESGELIYDSGRLHKMPKAEGGMFKLEVVIHFSLPMKYGSVQVTAGTEAPFNKYSMTGLRWSGDSNELTGQFQIPESDIPKSGAVLRFAISGESQAGGAIDGDVIAPGNQPNLEYFLMLGIQEFYNLSLESEGKMHASLRDFEAMTEVRPLTEKLKLMQDIPDYFAGAPNVYVEHFQNTLKFQDLLAGKIDKYVEKLEKELAEFRQDKEKYWRNLLAQKEKKLGQNKRGPGNPAKLPPALRDLQKNAMASYEKTMNQSIAAMEKDAKDYQPTGPDAAKEKADYQKAVQENIKQMKQQIADQKSGKTFKEGMSRVNSEIEADIAQHKKTSADQEFKYKEEYLKKEKQKAEFIRKEVMPRFEAAARMMMGMKQFRYIKQMSGPISVSFGGFTVEGKPKSGWYSENYSDYEGKMGEFEVKTAHFHYPGFQTNDAESLAQDKFNDFDGPKLFTWDYDLADYAKVRELAQMAGKYPDFVTQQFDPGPVRGTVNLDRDFEGDPLQREVILMPEMINGLLLEMSKLLWGFFPVKERPQRDEAHEVTQDRSVNPSALVMPELKSKRLIRLEAAGFLPRGYPLKFEGKTLYLFHQGFENAMPWIPSYGTETHIDETSGFTAKVTTTHYSREDQSQKIPSFFERGRTENSDWSSGDLKLIWTGVDPPPVFFDANHWTLRGMEMFSWMALPAENEIKFAIENNSCDIRFDAIRDMSYQYVFYGACDEDKISGTFTGNIQKKEENNDFEASWKTRLELIHNGEAKKSEKKAAAPVPAPTPAPPAPEPPKPEPKKPEPKKPASPWGQGYDSDTGITTEVQGHEDGSRTVTKTDKDGKVISTEKVPPPGERLPSGSSVDPYTGNKIEVQGNADGTRTVTRMDESGKVLSQEILKP